ncbi:MAG TPA: four helix bundle protein [Verrucomicrobiae bacterium]|nr:four helix bundle protein [Verrucomicrobiae bacterium]
MESTIKIKSYKDLLVWQKGINLVRLTYEMTKEFPADERFGLVSQLRRAAVSVPSNIAEGQSRHTTGEFIQFISHAEGSLAELETQIIISVDLSLTSSAKAEPILALIEELQRMLNSLRQKLATRHSPLATSHGPSPT